MVKRVILKLTFIPRYSDDVGSPLFLRVLNVKAFTPVWWNGISKEIHRKLGVESVESVDSSWIWRTRVHTNQKAAEKKTVRLKFFRLQHQYWFHSAYRRLFAQKSWNDTQRGRGLDYITVNCYYKITWVPTNPKEMCSKLL